MVVKRRTDGGYEFVNEKGEVQPISFHPLAGGISSDRRSRDRKAQATAMSSSGSRAARRSSTRRTATIRTRRKLEKLGVVFSGQYECIIDRVADPAAFFCDAQARRADLQDGPRIVQKHECPANAGHSHVSSDRTGRGQRAAFSTMSRLSTNCAHVADHVVGDDRVRFRGRVDGAAVEARHRPAAGCRTARALRGGCWPRGTRRSACGTAASGAHRACVPAGEYGFHSSPLGVLRGTRMLTPSASARLGSRAHMPRLVNSGMWSVTSVKPVPAPVARPPGSSCPWCRRCIRAGRGSRAGSRRSPAGAAG